MNNARNKLTLFILGLETYAHSANKYRRKTHICVYKTARHSRREEKEEDIHQGNIV
jgi:hypothetical protein